MVSHLIQMIRIDLFNVMKDVVEGKVDFERMGEASLGIINEYTPAKAARVVMETVKSVLKESY